MLSAYDRAQRFIGIKELKMGDHPLIQWWLSLCGFDPNTPDEVPWCSAFINGIAWDLRLNRSKSARARSWLDVGIPIYLYDAKVGYDVVILKRGDNPELGHVGFYAGIENSFVIILGGNQSNSVSLAKFPQGDVIGVRRLANG